MRVRGPPPTLWDGIWIESVGKLAGHGTQNLERVSKCIVGRQSSTWGSSVRRLRVPKRVSLTCRQTLSDGRLCGRVSRRVPRPHLLSLVTSTLSSAALHIFSLDATSWTSMDPEYAQMLQQAAGQRQRAGDVSVPDKYVPQQSIQAAGSHKMPLLLVARPFTYLRSHCLR